jgi:hypothetical protein
MPIASTCAVHRPIAVASSCRPNLYSQSGCTADHTLRQTQLQSSSIEMLGCRGARSVNLYPAELAKHLAGSHPTPLILPQVGADWPARDAWSLSDGFQRLRSAIGEDRAVEVELGLRGRGYLDGRYRRVSMGFGMSAAARRWQRSLSHRSSTVVTAAW